MKVNFEDIYRHIGFLFYGLVAKVNGLSPEHNRKLTEIIEKNWRQAVPGDFSLNMHLADCIQEGIRYARDNNMSANHALDSFRDYYNIHTLPFSPALKQRIVSTANEISSEFFRNSRKLGIKKALEDLLHISEVAR